MTTAARGAVVQQAQARYPVSVRAACRMLGFERTVLHYEPQRALRDPALCDKLHELASTHAG